jgi:hypothetical protein
MANVWICVQTEVCQENTPFYSVSQSAAIGYGLKLVHIISRTRFKIVSNTPLICLK